MSYEFVVFFGARFYLECVSVLLPRLAYRVECRSDAGGYVVVLV